MANHLRPDLDHKAGILNDFASSVKIVDWAYTQTFEGNGLTWFRADDLRKLPLNWQQTLAAFKYGCS